MDSQHSQQTPVKTDDECDKIHEKDKEKEAKSKDSSSFKKLGSFLKRHKNRSRKSSNMRVKSKDSNSSSTRILNFFENKFISVAPVRQTASAQYPIDANEHQAMEQLIQQAKQRKKIKNLPTNTPINHKKLIAIMRRENERKAGITRCIGIWALVTLIFCLVVTFLAVYACLDRMFVLSVEKYALLHKNESWTMLNERCNVNGTNFSYIKRKRGNFAEDVLSCKVPSNYTISVYLTSTTRTNSNGTDFNIRDLPEYDKVYLFYNPDEFLKIQSPSI